jgi:hypothetical protein
MKITTRPKPLAVLLTALIAAQAAFVLNTSQAQPTFQTVTNGLVDYYPLNSILGGATPDLISRRDMTLQNMTTANIVAASHPGINSSNLAFNFNQSGGPTLIYYNTTGQNPFNGSGDFLPFINQRGATMNFWVKAPNNLSGNEYRAMAECAQDGQSSPFFSISTKSGASLGTNASFFLRAQNPTTDPNGQSCYLMSDGSYEDPIINYLWNQGANDTTNNVFDNTWHMLTLELGTNGDMHVYVDGNYDEGDQLGGPWEDNEGNLTVAPSMPLTNSYYNTNIYPNLVLLPAGTNSAAGAVSWLMPDLCNSGVTVFGGYIRNGSINGGVTGPMSDIGFWNRQLSPAEIQWVMTNSLDSGLALNTNVILINSFAPGVGEIGQGGNVTLSWNIVGVGNTPGSIVISGLGDVSYLGPVGSTNITLPANQTYSFTLTAHNGIVANKQVTASVKVLQGVRSNWNLVQRFDGLFANTTAGVNGNNVTTLKSIYSGNLDVFNVVTVNGNEALSPKSGFKTDSGSSVGYDSAGAITYNLLNNLTVPPYQQNTFFFRFAVKNPPPVYNGNAYLNSGLDLAVGLTDFGFATGPLGGTTPPGTGGAYGPGIHIVTYDPSGNYGIAPFDITAADYTNSSTGNGYAQGYDYLTDAVNGNTNGLMTNVTYLCWLDVSNDNTHAVTDGSTYTNTVQEARFAFWIQAQGASSRTLLFSNFFGNRDYSQYGINSDFPTPYLNKVFASVCSESIANGDNGAFFATNNMVLLDDFYLSQSGYNGTIPRLFNLNTIAKAANGNVTISWESLGSLFQTNTYSVQRTLALHNPTWTTLTNGLPSGGDFTSYTDTTVAPNTAAFYRITWP